MSELLSKTRKVLDLESVDGDSVTFTQPDMEAGAVIEFSSQEWEDMGSPEEITVSIVPGDRLNG